MTTPPAAPSARASAIADAYGLVSKFVTESAWAKRRQTPHVCDFTFGNPHEMPLAGLVQAIQRWSAPKHKDWFAYKRSEPDAQRVVADSLSKLHSLAFAPDDI